MQNTIHGFINSMVLFLIGATATIIPVNGGSSTTITTTETKSTNTSPIPVSIGTSALSTGDGGSVTGIRRNDSDTATIDKITTRNSMSRDMAGSSIESDYEDDENGMAEHVTVR